MKVDDFNLAYFRAIRDEITKRIEIHFKLVIAKFVLVGAVLSYLLIHKEVVGLPPFLIASMFSFLFDIVILGNMGWVRGAGHYVKNNLEDTDLNIVKWEHDYTQIEGVWTCFTFPGYLLGVWVIGAAFLLGYIAMDFNLTESTKCEFFLLLLNWYLLPYTIYLGWKTLSTHSKMLGHKRKSPIVPS